MNNNSDIIDYKDYKGKYLYDEGTDKFYSDLEEIKKECEIIPKYMWATYYKPISIDLEYILDDICEEYDCTVDSLLGVDYLKKAIELFNNLNKDKGYYCANMNLIRLPQNTRGEKKND